MLEFSTTEIPSKTRSGRTPMDNPFLSVFPTDKNALTFTVKEGRASLEARRVIRQVRQAARANDRTGRITITDGPDGSAQFTVWTVEKIVRKPRRSRKSE